MINHLSPCSSRTFWGQYHWLILRWKTTCWWDLECSFRFTMWKAISVFPSILSNGLILGGQNISRTQSVFSCLLIQETKITKNQQTLTTQCRDMPETYKTVGEGIRIRYFGLILILESSKKDWSSIGQDRTQSSFRGRFQQVALWELKDWKAEKYCVKSNTCRFVHKSLWEMISIGQKGNDDLGSTVEHRPVGKLVQQSPWRNSSIWFFQANPIPKNQWRSFGETRSSRDC